MSTPDFVLYMQLQLSFLETSIPTLLFKPSKSPTSQVLDASPTVVFSCTPHFSHHITPFSFSSNNHTTFETSATTAYPSSVLMIDRYTYIYYIALYYYIYSHFTIIQSSDASRFLDASQAITSHVGTLLRAHDLSLQSLTCYLLNSLVYFPSVMFLWINPNPA